MTPLEMLDTFSTNSRRKGRNLDRAEGKPLLVDGEEVYPQAWRVSSESRAKRYQVRLVCAPGKENVSEREIHGASCTCPNGQNTPLGSPRCYHVAAVLHRLAGLD